MKKVFTLLILVAVPVLAALVSSPEQTSSAVQVPEALKTIFSGLIFAGVMLGLQVVFNWTGLDLRGLGAAIAASLSGFAIAELQGYINTIPVAYDHLVTIFLQIVVVILSGLGYLRLFSNPLRAASLFA